MNDKKSCENCRLLKTCYRYVNLHTNKYCHEWQRNPRKWLAIPPAEEGWYWWRRRKVEKYIPLYIFKVDGEWIAKHANSVHLFSIKRLGGEWQGPITPDG